MHALEFTSTKTESILENKSQKLPSQDANSRPATKGIFSSKNALSASKISQGSEQSEENSFPKTKGKVKNKQTTSSCLVCSGNHGIGPCPQFLNMPTSTQDNAVSSMKLCKNCLRSGHFQNDCRSPHLCRACYGSHHTLLHMDTGSGQSYHASWQDNNGKAYNESAAHLKKTVSCFTLASIANRTVLLATARVQLCDRNGHTLVVRALLDSGTESTLLRRLRPAL